MADDEDQNAKTGDSKEDRAARMNSAKAFYRAMYAGAEPDPEEFSLDLGGKAGAEEGAGSGRGGGDSSAVLHLQEQLKEAEAKGTEYENLYKRIIADFDNYKKRMDRERDEMQTIGMQKALEAILPGLDDLDMAQSKLTETTEAKVMLQSFRMILARFNKCLEQVGIKQLQVIGEQFDPRFHEPIQEVHTAEFPEGACVQQLRPGYIMGEKVLRPTLVNVATAPLDGPGYQPPAAASPATAAAEAAPAAAEAASVKEKVAVSEEEVISAGQASGAEKASEAESKPAAQAESPPEAKSEAQPEPKAEAKSEPLPEPKAGAKSEVLPEPKAETKSESAQVESAAASEGGLDETAKALEWGYKKGEQAEQYATQDIPLKEFKASLEAEAVAAGADRSEEKSSELPAEEAVASSEES